MLNMSQTQENKWETKKYQKHLKPHYTLIITFRFSSNRPTGQIRSSSRIVCLCVCLCVFLFIPFHVVYFEAFFAPISQSWMFKVFRDSESSGKSAGKKWSQNWTFLLWCVLKSKRKKKFFLCAEFALQRVEATLPDGLETSGQRVYC